MHDTELKLLAAAYAVPADAHYLRAVPDDYFSNEKLAALKNKLLNDEPLNAREVKLLQTATPEMPAKVYAQTLIEEGYLARAAEYAEEVANLAKRHRVDDVAARLINPPSKPSLEPPMTVHERLDKELASGIKYAYEYPPELKRVQHILKRIYPGSINVVAADNGGGKSLYLEQIALALSSQAPGVCDFSVEMPYMHRLFRYNQHISGHAISLDDYFEGKLSDEDIVKATSRVPKNLYIQTPSNINDVLGVAEELYHARGVNVFIVDFLQALQPLKGQTKYESIAFNIEAIYHFSKRFPSAWFIASQYNREGKKQMRTDKNGNRALPSNSDLLGANEIESYAWNIVHILDDGGLRRQMHISKNRFGTKGDVYLDFNETLLTFEAK